MTCLNSIDPLPCKLGNVLSKEELELRKKFIDIGSSNTASESNDNRFMTANAIKTDSPEQALGDNDAGVHKSWLQTCIDTIYEVLSKANIRIDTQERDNDCVHKTDGQETNPSTDIALMPRAVDRIELTDQHVGQTVDQILTNNVPVTNTPPVTESLGIPTCYGSIYDVDWRSLVPGDIVTIPHYSDISGPRCGDNQHYFAISNGMGNADMSKSRAYTDEEVVNKLLNAIRSAVSYWAGLPDNDHDVSYKLNGLAFSILNILDGTTVGLPAFDLVPHPHEKDKDFLIDNEENYFEREVINSKVMLHDLYYKQTDGENDG